MASAQRCPAQVMVALPGDLDVGVTLPCEREASHSADASADGRKHAFRFGVFGDVGHVLVEWSTDA